MARFIVRLRFRAFVLGLTAAMARAGAPGEVEATPSDRWEGHIQMGSMNIGFLATFVPDGDVWKATIDVPFQGVAGAPLTDVTYGDPKIAFSFQPKGAPAIAMFTAERGEDKSSASGEIEQAGMKFPFKMRRLAVGEEPDFGLDRPQTPKPPFPYDAEDVTYKNADDGTTLAGTLTIPRGDGPHPAVLLITGSGPQDRDETIAGHKPFLVIADHLTRNGIAVLRADDRGVGGSSGNGTESTADALVGDALAGVAFLKGRREIDAKHIGLLGHSEGGIIAPMAAVRSGDVAFVVMMAGTGLPGSDVLATQLAAILRASGVADEMVEQQIDVQQRLIKAVLSGADEGALRDATRELIALQQGRSAKDIEDNNPILITQVEQMKSPWFRSFLALDPRPALRKLRCPVLALNGSLDLQVLPSDNLPPIREALEAAPTKDYEVDELPGLNHLFQESKTGLPGEYAQITQTVSPKALEVMTDWIKKHVQK